MSGFRRTLGYVSSWNTVLVTSEYGVATGGTSSSITVGGVNYTLLTFSADGTLSVSQGGLFDCLLVGGGGGGWAVPNGGGGGGGGGVCQRTIYLPAGTHAITVGAGGISASVSSEGSLMGGASYIGTTSNAIVAVGGGNSDWNLEYGVVGASTAGSRGSITAIPRNGITTQGNRGGVGSGVSSAGGGGGAGGVGSAGSGSQGGAGGIGVDISAFLGQTAGTTYKGGGGGGCASAAGATGGTGGLGGGGNGSNGSSETSTAGIANSGGGGGGSFGTGSGGQLRAGGSGIVYVRFKV